jgi:hypothetical protein
MVQSVILKKATPVDSVTKLTVPKKKKKKKKKAKDNLDDLGHAPWT